MGKIEKKESKKVKEKKVKVVKEKKQSNKKEKKFFRPVTIVAMIFSILLIGFLVFLVVNKMTSESPKTKAEKKLSELADKFYEHYYDQKLEETNEEEVKTYIAEFKEIGLTIDLEDLRAYLDSFKIEDYSAFDKCNKSGTKVTVFPIEPFGKSDFRKSFTLNCKF